MALRGIISWQNPTTRVDGTAYNHQSEGAGYELALDSTEPLLVLPFAFGTEFDLNVLEQYRNLGYGEHVVRLRVVTRDQEVSDWASAPFRKVAAPAAPANLAMA